jgi:type I restriction enzyme S subunit
MKTYDSYKDSGIDWIGGIPEHWEVSRLKFVGESIIGLTYSPEEVTEDESGYLVLRSSNIQSGKLSLVDNVFVKKQINEKLITRKNDILICARNGSVDLVGKNILIDERTAGQTFGAFMTVFRGRSNQFVYWFFNSPFFDAQKGAFSTSTINQLTSNILNNLITTIPPLSEQTAIANYLDAKTTEIDQVVANKEALVNLYEEEKKALINEAVTKGVTLSGVETSSPKLKPSGIDWLGEIPKHWEAVPLTKYLDSIVDYRGRTPNKVEEGVFLVTAKNVKNGIIDYKLSEEFVSEEEQKEYMKRGEVKIGDVLFTTEAPLGEVANIDRIDICLAQRIIKFRANEYFLNNYFLKYWLRSYSFQQDLQTYATGSTALGIKASKLNNLGLVLPPLEEQTAIVRHIETETTKINDKINLIKQEIELLKEYRQALIFEAVTGKIRVH